MIILCCYGFGHHWLVDGWRFELWFVEASLTATHLRLGHRNSIVKFLFMHAALCLQLLKQILKFLFLFVFGRT